MPKNCYLSLSLFYPSLIWKTTPQLILELQRPFGLPPIGRWSSNSSETNILKLNSREFTMLTLTDGMQRISIESPIRRDGRWLSLRLPRIYSLEASQQLNGNPRQDSKLSISPAPTLSCSVWMRASNTLSGGETEPLYIVTVSGVHALDHMSYTFIVIPIIALAVTVKQIVIVSTCHQLKWVMNLQSMVGTRTSN